MAKIIGGDEFGRRREDAQNRYLALDEKLKILRRLLNEGLFDTAGRRIVATNHPLESERQKWSALLELPGSQELIDKTLQHTLTDREYGKLIILMVKKGLWP